MLHTILGIACFDPHFRDDLFDDPIAAVRARNLYTHPHDMQLLQAITTNKPSLGPDFEAVAKGICTHPPCPPKATGLLEVIGAALLDETFCEGLFQDAIEAANKHGFGLRYPETYELTTLIEGKNKTDLKHAIDSLRRKITQVINKAVMQEVA